MVGDFLGGFAGFLALLGGAALALELFRSMGRMVLGAAEEAAAAGLADASARRGDLTRMAEARGSERRARSARRRSVALGVGLGLWIVLPLALGGVREVWALAAPLWLLPRKPQRSTRQTLSGPETRGEG